jgi:nitrate reductase delta subunit
MSLWADSANPGGRFGSVRKGPAHVEAVRRVKDWTRSRFQLAEEETIVVTELAPSLPGFPPLETVVAFWTADGTRHHFAIFKPMENVVAADIPPAWLKDSLALSEGVECACC